jgi:hypothetical protein
VIEMATYPRERVPNMAVGTAVHPASPPTPGGADVAFGLIDAIGGAGVLFMTFVAPVPGLLPALLLAAVLLARLVIALLVVGVVGGAAYCLVVSLASLARLRGSSIPTARRKRDRPSARELRAGSSTPASRSGRVGIAS